MQRDPSSKTFGIRRRDDSRAASFEFKNLPFGEYKILAMSKNGNQDVDVAGVVDVRSPIPHFLELKKRIP